MIKSLAIASNNRMIAEQIAARGISDPRVLAAMRSVDRVLFVPEEVSDEAYADHPLPISHKQTISQPYIVGYMTALLQVRPDDRVLEIGTGTGYQTAILARLAREVWSLEIIAELAHTARPRLRRLGIRNAHILLGSGWEGLPERAPYDRILVAAAPPDVPAVLTDQLAVGGRLILPVGPENNQELILITRTSREHFDEDHRFHSLCSNGERARLRVG